MGDVWDRSDVYEPQPLTAPEFMWREEEDDPYDIEKEAAVLREHYNGMVEILRSDSGYLELDRMRRSISDNIERVEEIKECWRSRSNYIYLYYDAIEEEIANRSNEEGLSRGSVLNESIVEHWRREGLLRERWKEEGWNLSIEEQISGEGIDESTLGVFIWYEPSSENIPRTFEKDYLKKRDMMVFSGTEKWKDVLEKVKNKLEVAVGFRKQARRTFRLLRFRKSVADTVLRRFGMFGEVHEMTEKESQEIAEESKPGRPRRIENPEEVVKTLNVICDWLDTNPPKVFKGEGGLVNFASEKFPFSAQSTVRDRIRSTFRQLAKEYPDLPTPDLTTGTNGREYVERESEIRELRDEYTARFVEK